MKVLMWLHHTLNFTYNISNTASLLIESSIYEKTYHQLTAADPGLSNRGGAKWYVHAAHIMISRSAESLTAGV